MNQFARVAVASRAFSLSAILGLALVLDNKGALQATMVVTALGATFTYFSFSTSLPIHWVIAVEAGLASLVVTQALPSSVILLPYLVLLPLIAGLARGLAGASLSIALQLVAMTTLTLASGELGSVHDAIELVAPWTVTFVGSGVLGAWARKLGKSPAGTTAHEQYEAARRLLGQLRTVARRLSSGLDPVEISAEMLRLVHLRLHDEVSVVLVRTENGTFIPLNYRGANAQEQFDFKDAEILACWKSMSALEVRPDSTAGVPPFRILLPLRVGAAAIGVLITSAPQNRDSIVLQSLMNDLDELSVRLDTALAFDEVRSLVTADERQRLAREIHDGVAQEVASLGYIVDEICAHSNDEQTVGSLIELRRELSRVVSELRLSIFDLRTNVGTSGGLGSALSEHARKVGTQCGITVHLTLDEAPTRLTPSVETELLRIAQEAITNARKHSEAHNIWVHCVVKPPNAQIEIRDDGVGLGQGRDDSFGINIMKERADKIGARLDVVSDSRPLQAGTRVTVSVGKSHVYGAREALRV